MNIPLHMLQKCFSCIYISQGSAATQLWQGGIFNNHFIAKCPECAGERILKIG